MAFKDLNLNTSLLNALDDLGFTEPTTIQQKAFSVIMSGRDVCGIAQTGTGKTYAYMLPGLRMLNYAKDRFPQILVIVPTRELVVQVVDAVKELSKYLTLEVVGAYGGVNMKPQAAAIENGCDIVVATPGRLLDLVYNGSLRLKNIKKLVIDEVDEMMNQGFRTQLNNILALLPPRRQNLMFSATITPDVNTLIHEYFNDPVTIEATPVGTPLENIEQRAYNVPNFYTKVNLLQWLVENDPAMSKVLVFVATKALADQLYEQMKPKFGEVVGVMHSNKDQNNRLNTVKRFQDGTYKLLIATDIIARGLDIAGVSHVVNFDMPEVAEHYIHRIGRTGRAERRGIAIAFVTEKENERQADIEALMRYQVPAAQIPGEVEISTELTDDEQPKVNMKELSAGRYKASEGGGAFHEKLEKNKKVNVKVRHTDVMKAKYGKPKKRKPKK